MEKFNVVFLQHKKFNIMECKEFFSQIFKFYCQIKTSLKNQKTIFITLKKQN